MAARWISAILGVWMVIASWVLGHTLAAGWMSDFWTGVVLIVVALISTSVRSFRFVSTGVGVWLLLAPFALAYGVTAPVVNDVVVGAVVILLSLVPNEMWGGERLAGGGAAPGVT